jgi:tRNA A-37 threonylcarbamoyl transferase component Bud32
MPDDRVRVGDPFSLDRSAVGHVLRFQEGEPTVARSAGGIWKRARHYDRLDPRPVPKTAWALFNEWAALSYLDRLRITPRISPTLISANHDTGVLAMEDLGDTPSLVDVLHAADPDAAADACVAHSRAMARLHRATIGHDTEFHRERDALGPGGRHSLYQDYGTQINQFRTVCDASNVDWRTSDGDLCDVLSSMETPAPEFHGMLHGDVGPGNEKIIGADVVLIDFEVAGFGHVLREAVAARLVFTEGDNSAALPPELVAAMEAAYRTEFGVRVEDWCRDYALCAGFHAMAEIGWDAVTGSVGWRTAYRCRAFVDITEETGHLGSLGHTMRELARSMPPCVEPPRYPAFR